MEPLDIVNSCLKYLARPSARIVIDVATKTSPVNCALDFAVATDLTSIGCTLISELDHLLRHIRDAFGPVPIFDGNVRELGGFECVRPVLGFIVEIYIEGVAEAIFVKIVAITDAMQDQIVDATLDEIVTNSFKIQSDHRT
ncbi:uncharacterized protein N7518_010483 [Penicillium psychrosexuale]|uniref:uncharacterized protein n=1 Tax=Penicillium psychrosexuale TaxID=1002107 RepID=UPI0025459102|nr:uncharacterized protein N7518_010483 [Penicillium psychrosexuale]KAJ5782000.1 hypothetical protein N7518_010483 [Penicillium psychrosexuale]